MGGGVIDGGVEASLPLMLARFRWPKWDPSIIRFLDGEFGTESLHRAEMESAAHELVRKGAGTGVFETTGMGCAMGNVVCTADGAGK